MASPHWPERLRHELEERGLPGTYSARLLEELTEHLNDIQRENLSMEALASAEEKLGTPESLAAAAQKEYLRRTFAGRHPFLTFVIGPIPIVFVTWYVLVLLCFSCKSFVAPYKPANMLPPTAFEWLVVYGQMNAVRFLPFVLLALFFVRVGRRACRPALGMVACGIVAYIAFINDIYVLLPTDEHNLAVGFAPQLGLWRWQDRWLQAAIPLAVGMWTWRRSCKPSCGLPLSPLPAPRGA